MKGKFVSWAGCRER